MSKGGTQQQETPQQRAAVDHAVQLMADYKKRWLPVQQQLAGKIQAMGEPGSAAEKMAEGKASTDTAIQFAQAQGALEKSLSNHGAGVGSSRSNLAIAGLGNDVAKSTGLSKMIADEQIDDAYTQGLGALMASGRGQRASVGNSLGRQAAQSGAQARQDAQLAMQDHMGDMAMVGQAAGYGLQAGLGAMMAPKVGVTGTNDIKGGGGSDGLAAWGRYGVGGD